MGFYRTDPYMHAFNKELTLENVGIIETNFSILRSLFRTRVSGINNTVSRNRVFATEIVARENVSLDLYCSNPCCRCYSDFNRRCWPHYLPQVGPTHLDVFTFLIIQALKFLQKCRKEVINYTWTAKRTSVLVLLAKCVVCFCVSF